jgi:hypothetical protein
LLGAPVLIGECSKTVAVDGFEGNRTRYGCLLVGSDPDESVFVKKEVR